MSYKDVLDSTQPTENIPGVPDYGWRVSLDYTCPVKCKPFNSPRLKHVLPQVCVGIRYMNFWCKKRKEGKKPFIDNVRMLPHLPIYGVPIGGLGCGTIGRGYRGEFCRYQMVPGMYEHKIIPANQFIVCVRRGGETVYQQVLSSATRPKKMKKRLKSWQWDFDGSQGVYHGLYPRSWTIYDLPGQNIRLICQQISPVFPHDYQDTSLPVAVFVWQIENKGDDPVDVSITFTFKNGVGTKADSKGGCWTEPFTSEGDVASGMMIHQQFKTMPCTYALSVAKRNGVEVSHKLSFDPRGSGEEVWSDLLDTGSLQPGSPRGSDQCTVKGEEVGVAMCGQCTVGSRTTAQMEMCLTWDMPVIHFGANSKRYARRYARWFGQDGVASPKLASHCLKMYSIWEEKIDAWQNPILQNPQLPSWYKSAIFNELYYVSDGGSIWVDRIEDFTDNAMGDNPSLWPHLRQYGRFVYLEGHEYRMYNTYDVHYYASFALVMLWPMLQLSVQYEFVDAIKREDTTLVKYLYSGNVGPLKPKNVVPHDLGDPEDEPWEKINAYVSHATYDWKDLNMKFVLQVYRDYTAVQSVDYLRDMYPSVKALLEYSLCFDEDGDGIIDNGGYPDQTYDAWTSTGASAYCGGIWLTALRMAVEMAAILDHDQDKAKFQEILDRGSTSFEEKLWNGRYYDYDTSKNVYHDSIMADMLSGPWYLRASHLQDDKVFPSDHVKSALQTIFDTNVMTFADGHMGAINGMRPNGKKDLSSMQADEFWVGTTYGVAAAMIQEGMIEEGFQTASGPYHVCYEYMGLAFQTPEAYFDHKTFRSLGYMRPLCIWAIQWALEKCQPQILQPTNLIAENPADGRDQVIAKLATSNPPADGSGDFITHVEMGDVTIETNPSGDGSQEEIIINVS